MPPRKRAKPNVPAVETTVANHDAMAIDTPTAEDEEPTYDMLKDPWTDEQETSLFKGIMRWKPNGMHKHFRMVALSEYLRNHGYDPRIEKHTSIQGIWAKLDTMYDMKVIDERENTFEWEEELRDKYADFKLPDEWAQDMFYKGKRTGSEAPSSPSYSEASAPAGRKRKRGDTITAKTRASTVEDTDEARSSPPAKATTRSGRTTNRSMGRVAADSSRSRQPSKDTTADDETVGDDEEEEDVEEDDGSPSPKPKSKTKGKVEKTTARKSKRKR